MGLEIKTFVHGVSKGHKVWSIDHTEDTYFNAFYVQPWKEKEIMIAEVREYKGTTYCYYSFVRGQKVLGADRRDGSYFVITLRINMCYTDLMNMYHLLRAAYEKACVGMCIDEKGNFAQITTDNFEEKESELKQMHKGLVYYIYQFSRDEDLTPLTGFQQSRGKDGLHVNNSEAHTPAVVGELKRTGCVLVSHLFDTSGVAKVRKTAERNMQQCQADAAQRIQQARANADTSIRQVEQRYASEKQQLLKLLDQEKQRVQSIRQEEQAQCNKKIQEIQAQYAKSDQKIQQLNGIEKKWFEHFMHRKKAIFVFIVVISLGLFFFISQILILSHTWNDAESAQPYATTETSVSGDDATSNAQDSINDEAGEDQVEVNKYTSEQIEEYKNQYKFNINVKEINKKKPYLSVNEFGNITLIAKDASDKNVPLKQLDWLHDIKLSAEGMKVIGDSVAVETPGKYQLIYKVDNVEIAKREIEVKCPTTSK